MVTSLSAARSMVVALLLGGIVIAPLAIGADAATTWTMPEADRQAIRELAGRATAFGLPDVTGGTLYEGMLTLVLGSGPSSVPGAQRSAFPFNGLHIKCPDGTWVVCCTWPTTDLLGVTVDASQAAAITVEQLVTKSAASDAHADERAMALVPPDQRPMVAALAPIRYVQDRLWGDAHEAVSCIHLIRLDYPQAHLLALGSSFALMWDEDARLLVTGAPSPMHLMPDDRQAEDVVRMRPRDGSADRRVPDIVSSFRRMLVLSLFHQMRRSLPKPFLPLPPERAAQAILELSADEPELAQIRTEVSALAARAVLPGEVPGEAGLVERLMVWDERASDAALDHGQSDITPEYLEHVAASPDQELAHLDDVQREDVRRLRVGRSFAQSDIGALVALAGDRRPCRWLDSGRTRTLGDNALRAMGAVMGCDPRLLLGRNPRAPWSEAEREATITALNRWWAANQGKPLVTWLGGAIGHMPLVDVTRVLKRSDAKQHAQLLVQLAAAWKAAPPADPDPDVLAAILAEGKGVAALAKVVDAWPVSGRPTLLLAAWRLMQGEGQAFDGIYADALAAGTQAPPGPVADPTGSPAVPPGSPMSGRDTREFAPLASVIAIAMRHPSADRLQRLLAAIASMTTSSNGQDLERAITRASTGVASTELATLWGLRDHGDRRKKGAATLQAKAGSVLWLAVMGTLLNDQRPAPDWLIRAYGHRTPAADQAPSPNPLTARPSQASDVRVGDIAVQMFHNQGNGQLEVLFTDEDMQHINAVLAKSVDLGAPKAARDQRILDLRRVIAAALPLALTAAGMPAKMPGITDVPQAGDDLSSF